MDAQLAIPFEDGSPKCTIYLDLTREDLRLLQIVNKTLKQTAQQPHLRYSLQELAIPLLDAIIAEAEKEIP